MRDKFNFLPGNIDQLVFEIFGIFEKRQSLCIHRRVPLSNYHMLSSFQQYQRAIDCMLRTFLREAIVAGNQKDDEDILMNNFHTNQE